MKETPAPTGEPGEVPHQVEDQSIYDKDLNPATK